MCSETTCRFRHKMEHKTNKLINSASILFYFKYYYKLNFKSKNIYLGQECDDKMINSKMFYIFLI